MQVTGYEPALRAYHKAADAFMPGGEAAGRVPGGRLKTKTIGFKLGGFGFSYRSREIVLDDRTRTGQSCPTCPPKYRAMAFSQALETAAAVDLALGRPPEPEMYAGHGAPRRGAAKAYQYQAQNPDHMPTARLMAVV